MAAALIVPLGAVGLSATSSGAAALPGAQCTGTNGTASYTPGLKLTTKANQTVGLTGVQSTCTKGIVTSATVSTLTYAGYKGLHSPKASCNTLLANLKNNDLPFSGEILAAWNPGMGHTTIKITAFVRASSGQSTSFAFQGTTTDSAHSPFAAGRKVFGSFVVQSGLHTMAQGGNCQATIPLTGGGISASSLTVG